MAAGFDFSGAIKRKAECGFVQSAERVSRGVGNDADLCAARLRLAVFVKQFQRRTGITTKLVLDNVGLTIPCRSIIFGIIESTRNEFDFGFHHKPLLAALKTINDVCRKSPNSAVRAAPMSRIRISLRPRPFVRKEM